MLFNERVKSSGIKYMKCRRSGKKQDFNSKKSLTPLFSAQSVSNFYYFAFENVVLPIIDYVMKILNLKNQ